MDLYEIDLKFEKLNENLGYTFKQPELLLQAFRHSSYVNEQADERLEIHTKGKLYGNIRTAKLKIADGVIFEGNCEMIKEKPKVDSGKKKN